MTITWERLQGSTSAFAIRLTLLTDPHDGAGVDVDTAASWGALQMWVQGQNVCAHSDQDETLVASRWYLLPMLEWIASNWDALFHEERFPVQNNGDNAVDSAAETRFAPIGVSETEALEWETRGFEWWTRHALRSARDGGLVPNVYFRRYQDLVEIAWDDEQVAGQPDDIRFLASRRVARLDPELVTTPLYDVCHAVASELASRLPESDRVQALLQRFQDLTDGSAHEDARLGWLVGIARDGDTSSASVETWWRRLRERASHIGAVAAAGAAFASVSDSLVVRQPCQAALMFGSAEPVLEEDDIETLVDLLLGQYSGGSEPVALADLVVHQPIDLETPAWKHGYELAEELYDRVEAGDVFVDIEKLLSTLGVETRDIALSDRLTRAVSIAGYGFTPVAAINSRSFTSRFARRFTLAHEFCHILFDRQHGQRLAVLSGPWAPREIERRANAFAAMFLMPVDLVQRAVQNLTVPAASVDGISALSEELRVNPRTVVDHLRNIAVITDVEQQELLASIRTRA